MQPSLDPKQQKYSAVFAPRNDSRDQQRYANHNSTQNMNGYRENSCNDGEYAGGNEQSRTNQGFHANHNGNYAYAGGSHSMENGPQTETGGSGLFGTRSIAFQPRKTQPAGPAPTIQRRRVDRDSRSRYRFRLPEIEEGLLVTKDSNTEPQNSVTNNGYNIMATGHVRPVGNAPPADTYVYGRSSGANARWSSAAFARDVNLEDGVQPGPNDDLSLDRGQGSPNVNAANGGADIENHRIPNTYDPPTYHGNPLNAGNRQDYTRNVEFCDFCWEAYSASDRNKHANKLSHKKMRTAFKNAEDPNYEMDTSNKWVKEYVDRCLEELYKSPQCSTREVVCKALLIYKLEQAKEQGNFGQNWREVPLVTGKRIPSKEDVMDKFVRARAYGNEAPDCFSSGDDYDDEY